MEQSPKFFRKILAIFPVLVMFATLTNSAIAQPQLSSCLLSASTHQMVSLGIPVAPERLAFRNKIRIGILPISFTNEGNKTFSETEKLDYLAAAKKIEGISRNEVSVEVVFLPIFNSKYSSSDLKLIYDNRGSTFASRELSKSTFGVVKSTLIDADPNTNYKDLNGVILEGNNSDKSFAIQEAMGFFRGSPNSYFEQANEEFFSSVVTKEDTIDNAILLDRHANSNVITHEIFHNFGLTDLYGNGSFPANLSIMNAVTSTKLFNYEKAVLGWFPENNFKCAEYSIFSNQTLDKMSITFQQLREENIFLLKLSSTKAYVFETAIVEGKIVLICYQIDNEVRPPITGFTIPTLSYMGLYDLTDVRNIGNIYQTYDFKVLISNIKSDTLILNLIPNDAIGSKDADALIAQSYENREELVAKAEADAKAKAEADAKAKAEADAKSKSLAMKTTINCVKGKATKKVTALNPKCPTGYKKK